MGIIHVLEDYVANQIAAGEVIERPVSAVKELIENALDAHAKNIIVELENGGLDRIVVTDDGDGFYSDDLKLATKRHATSKISNFNDVYKLSTFGFRGEALASIAAISRMRIVSGRSDSEPAYTFYSEPLGKEEFSVAPPKKGTIIEIRDLYFNVPARKKFVRSNHRESNLIYDLICKFAMGLPEINFTYKNNGSIEFSSNQMTTTEQVMTSVYSGVDVIDIISFTHEDFYHHQSLQAWFYPPNETRKNRNEVTYFVNDRLIESHELDQILDEAIYTLIPKGRFPICVLKLKVPASSIDVNVHPSKRVIKFRDYLEWKEQLITLIKEDLWLSRLNVPFKPVADFPTYEEQEIMHPVSPQRIEFQVMENIDEDYEIKTEQEKSFNSFIQNSNNKFSESTNIFEQEASIIPIDVVDEAASYEKKDSYATNNENLQPTNLLKNDFQEIDYIGQLNNTFILAQDRSNLYIIDQHTLHERILYEKFMKAYSKREIIKQPILHPEQIALSPLQEETVVAQIFLLSELGFTLEKAGDHIYQLNTVPSLLTHRNDFKHLFLDLLDDLENELKTGHITRINEDALIMASCKSAVKANYRLQESDVKYLFSQLSTLDNPHTCPHGRPIIMNITMNELYLFFKRGSY